MHGFLLLLPLMANKAVCVLEAITRNALYKSTSTLLYFLYRWHVPQLTCDKLSH